MRRRAASIQRHSLIILLRRSKFSSSLRSTVTRFTRDAISMTLLIPSSSFLLLESLVLGRKTGGAAFSPNFFHQCDPPESQFRFPSIKLAEYRGDPWTDSSFRATGEWLRYFWKGRRKPDANKTKETRPCRKEREPSCARVKPNHRGSWNWLTFVRAALHFPRTIGLRLRMHGTGHRKRSKPLATRNNVTASLFPPLPPIPFLSFV